MKGFSKELEKNIKNDRIVKGFEHLIEECKEDILKIENNSSFNKVSKEQTLSVLSNVTLKMEMIMDIK